MGTLTVRKAVLSDAEGMTALDELCFDLPWSLETFMGELAANENAFYIVAEVDGKPVGYAGLWAIAGEGHITNVAVHPDYRRKQIAKALVKLLIEASEAAGLEAFTLEVRVSNAPAIALYEQFGFEPSGVRKGYYLDNDEDALIMWRGSAIL